MKEQLPDKWQAGEAPKVCEQCSYVGEGGFKVLIHPDVLGAAFHLCKEIGTEWQMFLSGSVDGNRVYCTGYYIPKQEVTHSTVKNLEAVDKKFIEDRDIVATIHSHALMGVFFSPTDDEFTNMSFIKHHVVINNSHEFCAKSRHDLPCGGVKFVTSQVETIIPTVDEAVGKDKIGKYEYKSEYAGNTGFSTHQADFYGRQDWNDDYGYWNGDVWQPAHKGHGSVREYSGYKKVNGVWKQERIGY